MVDMLDLSDAQKEAVLEFIDTAAKEVRSKYIANLEKDRRTKAHVTIVEDALIRMIEESFAQVGREINRGAIISSVAVSADTKNKDFNKIELNSLKHAGDITIPTRGVFMATNCIDIMKGSVEVDLTEPEAETETKTEDETNV